MDWRTRAGCLNEDPELFFPLGDSGPGLAQLAQAKSICGRCQVSTECLTWAMAGGLDAGVWGGLSAHERRALRSTARRVQPPPTCATTS